MSGLQRVVINCNEAIAWAGLASGVDFLAHYPGSPVNFVERELARLSERFQSDIRFNNSLNEHIAVLSAAGASYCGARSMVVMKHVGLNIAADPLNYLGYTGVVGGMVVVVGTDPGANSSTGEEDVHWYVPQFNFPLFEPTSVQTCFEQVKESFVISERYGLPVMIFVPGRLAFNYESIEVPMESPKRERKLHFVKNEERYINVGGRAVRNHKALLEKVDLIGQRESFIRRKFKAGTEFGCITRGLSFSITCEVIARLQIEDYVDLLNLDMVYPLNRRLMHDFIRDKREIVFIEDQDGFCEYQTKMVLFNELECEVRGKDVFRRHGELSYEDILSFFSTRFGFTIPSRIQLTKKNVPENLGTFCEGCPHRGSYYAIDVALENRDGIIGGDIGCSSLPPFRADWLLCMNAGIGISQGMAQIMTGQSIVSTGGEGSFFHGGALSLMSAVHNKINLIHIVFDNQSIAMTGHQRSPTEGFFDHRKFLEAIGVDRVIDVWSYDPLAFSEKLKSELDKTGVRVFWVKGTCVRVGNKYIEDRRKRFNPIIDPSRCGTCSRCYLDLGCPAILNLSKDGGQELTIDLNRCMRCGICHAICPNDAITIHEISQAPV